MADKVITGSAVHSRPINDIGRRSIMTDHVEVGRYYFMRSAVYVARNRQRFEENLRQNYRRSNVYKYSPAFGTGDLMSQNFEIVMTCAGRRRGIILRMLANNIGVDRDMDHRRQAQTVAGGQQRMLAITIGFVIEDNTG